MPPEFSHSLGEAYITPAPDSCYDSGDSQMPVFHGDYSFNTGRIKKLKYLDYCMFSATLVISTLIGIYVSWRNRRRMSLNDYLMAGRTMGALPAGMSLLAGFMSAITLLGAPTEFYIFNTMYVWMGLSYLLVCAAAAEIYMPVLYQLKITSIYQYLEMRFSRRVRTCAASFFMIQMLIYLSVVLFAPSVAIHAVTGLNLWGVILSVGLVCTLYTALGGMRAVMYNDTFQAITMILGLLVVVACAMVTIPEWRTVWASATRSNRNVLFDVRTSPFVRHSVWSILVGGYSTWVAIYACNQGQVLKCLSCRSLRQAKLCMWSNVPGLWTILYLSCIIGLYMSTFYESCDPLKAGIIDHKHRLLPLFVMDIMGHRGGLPGLFLAALFSGALGSVSSGLNAISSVILEDFIRQHTHAHIREDRARIISQVTVVILGLFCVQLTYLASRLQDILQFAVLTNGALLSPILGAFSLGMFFPWANEQGAFSGILASFLVNAWMIYRKVTSPQPPHSVATTCVTHCNMTVIGTHITNHKQPDTTVVERADEFHEISYLLLSTSSVVMCIGIGLLISFMTEPREPKSVDPRLIVPLADIVFPFFYMSEEFKKKLRFGINHSNKWSKAGSQSRANSSTKRDLRETDSSLASSIEDDANARRSKSKRPKARFMLGGEERDEEETSV